MPQHSKQTDWLVAALYKFVTLDEPSSFQQPLLSICTENKVNGTLLLAQEGINGTIAGSDEGIQAVLEWLRSKSEFKELDAKFSRAKKPPFLRMKVRLKKEIVTLGVEGIDPNKDAGTYVSADKWNELISQPDVVLVDTRNDYEVAIGTFKGAQNPNTNSFRDFPTWVDETLDVDPNTKIAMFCTGGIRCEKSTALMKAKGFNNVFHLEGGILKYLENTPKEESLWEGQCFVFDERVSVGHDLIPGDYDLCHACRNPISADEKASEHYQLGVSCPHCYDRTDAKRRKRFADRQLQMDLAKQRNVNHLAANITQARARKHKIREKQQQKTRTE